MAARLVVSTTGASPLRLTDFSGRIMSTLTNYGLASPQDSLVLPCIFDEIGIECEGDLGSTVAQFRTRRYQKDEGEGLINYFVLEPRANLNGVSPFGLVQARRTIASPPTARAINNQVISEAKSLSRAYGFRELDLRGITFINDASQSQDGSFYSAFYGAGSRHDLRAIADLLRNLQPSNAHSF